MKNYLKITKTSIFILTLLLAFIPLIVADGLFFPYITGKGFAFRLISEIILALYIPVFVFFPEYRPRLKSLYTPLLTFIAVIFVADIFAVNSRMAFWSNFERMEGFLTLFLFISFGAVTSFFLEEKEWKKYFAVSLFVNTLVVFLAIFELFSKGFDFRIQGTLGNAGYLSIYAVWGIFLCLYFFINQKKQYTFLSFFLSFLAFLNFFVLWKTQTRGTLIGLFVGIITVLGLYLFTHLRKKFSKVKVYSFFVLGFVSLFFSVRLLFPIFAQIEFVKNNPTLSRLASISLNEQTVRSRFMIWEMSYEGFKERPILGYGQDNFIYVFAQKYNPEMFDQEQWFDRSHNVFFDWLIAGGLLGLISYLSLFAALLYVIIKNKNQTFKESERNILIGFLITYFVHNIFIFDNLSSYLIFFSLFSYVIYKNKVIKKTKTHEGKIKNPLFIVFFLTTVIFIFSVYFTIYKPFVKNRTILNVLSLGPNIYENSKYLVEDNSLYGNSEAREQLSDLVKKTIFVALISPEIKKAFFELAVLGINKDISSDPLNPRPLYIASSLYDTFGDKEMAVKMSGENLKRAPNKPIFMAAHADLLIKKGDYKEGESVAINAFDLTNRSFQNAIVLGTFYENKKELDKSYDVMNKYIKANKNDLKAFVNAMLFFKKFKSYKNLDRVIKELVEIYPETEKEIKEFLDNMPETKK